MITKSITNKKVYVAMSGGVDSSVVAGLMKDADYDVVGVTMCFSITHPNSKKPSCCGVDGIQDAKRAAQILDIPHYVLDFAKDINDFIIEDFVSEYLNGRTPNPCVRCNQHLKFGSLYQKVRSLGAGAIATGHYGKIEFNEQDGRYEMKKAKDPRKDQSYFLYSVKRETLPHVLFPLGDFTKQEVRELARKYNLNTADKAESQDICFVPDTGYKKFIEDRVGSSVFVPGPFVNEKGEVVGEHRGILNYTIGQRDKLGLALGYPVYVYKIEKETNKVYVGPLGQLYSNGLIANQLNLVSLDTGFPENNGGSQYCPSVGQSQKNTKGRNFENGMEVNVRIRYNAPEVKGIVTQVGAERVRVDFPQPQKSVTPGQSVVFYRGDIVLGGAIIESPIPCENYEIPQASVPAVEESAGGSMH